MGQYYEQADFYNAPNLYTFFPLREFCQHGRNTRGCAISSGVDGEATNAYHRSGDLTPT